MQLLTAENLNGLWSALLFEEWRRLGLRHVVVCPGSRSSPLSVAAARTPGLRLTIVTDERVAGFVALGAARSSGRPVAVITTSGSAVANLLPSAVEASLRAAPILYLTADRPPELRECGANQSIPQVGIFGGFTRWAFELPCPDEAIAPSWVLSVADEAWTRANAPVAGPVHLNCAFREPLAPTAKPYATPKDARFDEWLAERDRPWRRELPPTSIVERESLDEVAAMAMSSERVLVACGESSEPAACRAAARLAEALGAPLLADAGAGGLRGANARAVPHPDLVLAGAAARGDAMLARLRPDVVVRVGGSMTSRRVNDVLSGARATVATRVARDRIDDRHRASLVMDAASLDTLATAVRSRGHETAFARDWRAAGAAAARAVCTFARDAQAPDEPWLTRTLLDALDERHVLLAGNSMPVRDVDALAPVGAGPGSIVTNRGASGIDGLVSTAVGHALAGARPVVALLGDLSLLHDVGGLGAIRSAQALVHVVVINNDGGGIFHFLPIAAALDGKDEFERLFGTPHGLTFEHAAAMFGLAYRPVTSCADARSACAAIARADRPHLVECRTNRHDNVGARRAIQESVATALAEALR